MQLDDTKLIFITSFSVLDVFKFASRMPQIAHILVSTFKIFRERMGVGRGGGGGGGRGCIPADPSQNFLCFFSLVISGSDVYSCL